MVCEPRLRLRIRVGTAMLLEAPTSNKRPNKFQAPNIKLSQAGGLNASSLGHGNLGFLWMSEIWDWEFPASTARRLDLLVAVPIQGRKGRFALFRKHARQSRQRRVPLRRGANEA